MNIEQTLKERAKEAETTVVSYLPEVTGYPKTVLEAMEYSVEAGGKRIRPVLMREVYHMYRGFADRTFYGGNRDDSYVLSCA